MSLVEPYIESYVQRIDSTLDTFLVDQINTWNEINPAITVPIKALRQFVATGGKRLRPLFCLLGYKAAGGIDIPDNLINIACSLEMLHSFALIHDDFMDRADTRRFKPTVHKQLYLDYSSQDYIGDVEHFANSVSILTGDFAFSYADSFMKELPLSCRNIYDLLKIELFAGQQLDLDAAYRSRITLEEIILIAQYKSGRYTIERPLQLGANLKGDISNVLWEGYGRPLGEAFQLRDDVLGIFGDVNSTGKPVGDDIKEGKFTILISKAIQNANQAQLSVLEKRGNVDLAENDIDEIIDVIEETGARQSTEDRIEDLYNESMDQIQRLKLDEEIYKFADDLARHVCWRQM